MDHRRRKLRALAKITWQYPLLGIRPGSDQCSIPNAQFSADENDSMKELPRPRPPSVRIRIEHWELNIGQTPIEHSAKLFLREPSVRPFSHQRHRRDQLRAIRPPRWAVLLRTSTERLGRVEISVRVHRELVHAPECARERPVSSPRIQQFPVQIIFQTLVADAVGNPQV